VVRLLAGKVRAIDPLEVADRDKNGQPRVRRQVDVIPDPLDDNDAHALIVTLPQIAKTGSAWSKVRAALAVLANEEGWAVSPA
jgi:hypothetical protein